ncbi:MAG: Non-ribosomal peptide synthetase component, partial [Chthonomonadales bacterium]|nr:Non-ribosomal peptide synthetase component [Chthonomonadales bacterium]
MQAKKEESPLLSDANITDLSSERSARLAKRLAVAVVGRNRPQGIPRRTSAAPPPLSFVQERIWLHCRYHPADAHAYHRLLAVRLQGSIDALVLEQSILRLLHRHETLRTTFALREGQPVQIIATDIAFTLPVRNLPAVAEEEWEAAVERIAREETHRPFDLEAGPLFRACLIESSASAPRPPVLILTLHHLISDGWSDSILLRELIESYAAPLPEQTDMPATSSAAEVQYGDFVLWQRERMQSEPLARQLAYWRQRLTQALPALLLPTDRLRLSTVSTQGARLPFTIDGEIANALTALGQQEGCTLFMTLLAGFKALLHRDCGQTDIAVVSPVAGRTHKDTENMIGCFINSLVLRTNIEGDPSFRELLRRVRTTCLEAYSNQEVPYEQIVEETPMPRGVQHGDLFRVLFQLRNVPKQRFAAGELVAERLMPDIGLALYDLNVEFYEQEDGLHGFIDYKTDLFDPATISGLVRCLQMLLAGAAATPETPLSQLPLLSTQERRQLLVEWNDTSVPLPSPLCLHQRIGEQAQRTPNAIALRFANHSLTYAQLDARANQLAHRLQEAGAGPEMLVGLCAERSVEMVIGLLGILKAGAAYVPLDPAYPQERLQHMVADAAMSVILTRQALQEILPPFAGEVICLDAEAASLESYPTDTPASEVRPDNLAYVIYTSGSTGKPKGAMNTHRAICNRLLWMQAEYQLSESDRVLQKTPYSFDVSVWEFFWPLMLGACLVVAPPELHKDPTGLVALVQAQEITTLHFVPSMLQAFLEESGVSGCASLQRVICSGEALPASLVERFYARLGCPLHNLYGPTEAAVDVTFWECPREGTLRSVPIGRPVWNTQLYVLDAHLSPQPIGVAGELYLGGVQVGRGYLNQPELTAEKFVPDPFSDQPGARLYRTGDLCRYLPDGNVEYLGRMDHQVKIRGFRIELGEIETALSQHPAVREAVVLAREDMPGDKRLVAYVVSGASAVSVNALREHLHGKLPDYMIPAAFVFLEALPLSPNGKIDRKTLPEPAHSGLDASGTLVAPRTATEAKLAEIWQEVLGIDRISIEANFFEIGGHSLIAMRAMSRIRDAFQTDLSLRALFEAPTPASMAVLLSQRERETQGNEVSAILISADSDIRIVPRSHSGPCPLSFGQQRLWFLDSLVPDSAQYLLPTLLRLNGDLNLNALQQALDAIVERHSILRTTFALADAGPIQILHSAGQVTLEQLNLSGFALQERAEKAQAQLHALAHCPLDLAKDSMLRASLIQMGPIEHLLLLTMHHIASDEWSQEIFFRELSALYTAFCQDRPSPLPALPLQYADFAVWQRQWLSGERLQRQMTYWKTHMAGAPPVLALPTDRPRTDQPTYMGARAERLLPLSLVSELQALSRSQGTTLFMTLLAAFQVLLARYSGQEDIVVGTPIANRTQEQLENLIGFFVNTLALRGDLSGDPTFVELLGRVRETALQAYAHQDLPFEKLVEELQPERSLQHNPLFQVMFILQNTTSVTLEMDGLQATPLPLDTGATLFDLTLSAVESETGLQLSVQYATDLFDPSTIERMLTHLQILLEAVVATPEQPISCLPLLSASERHQLLVEWNDTQVECPLDRSIPQLFQEQVQRTPEAIAVEFADQRLTYAQLNARANQWAHILQKQGVQPNSLVGLMTERSLDMIVAVLAILKAGGAYLPLDPTNPTQRRHAILQEAQPCLILTQDHFEDRLAGLDCPVLSLEQESFQNSTSSQETPVTSTTSEDLAYVMFTSGSTGQPKGVAVAQRGVVRLVKGANFCHLGADEVILQFAPLAFDASTFEIWGSLLNGGRLVVCEEQAPSLQELGSILRERQITTLWLTAGLFHTMVEHNLEALQGVRQ